MKRGSVENILYIGLDESNHGGNPEICVAIFSTLQKDSRPRTLDFKRKDYNLLSGVDKRDYRFLMLFKNQIKESENKLAIVAPSLIIPYLKSKGLENKGCRVKLPFSSRTATSITLPQQFLAISFPLFLTMR